MPEQCCAIARSGQRCGSAALPGLEHCWLHAPEKAAERREAARRGGHARSNRERAKRQLTGNDLSSDDLKGILAGCISKVLRGDLEANIANAVSGLVKTYLSVDEKAGLESLQSEIEELKRALRQPERAA